MDYRITTTFILLLIPCFCKGEVNSNTLELPKKNVAAETRILCFGPQDYNVWTDHYDIRTDQLEGYKISEQLEHLYNVWQLLFTKQINKEESKPAEHRHNVRLFKGKEEYVQYLQRIDPAIAQSNGYYYPPKKTAYFFSTETKIIFHEGTHQLLAEHFFHETKPTFQNNFWVAEGIALFMETLKIEDECYKIGDVLADRLYSSKVYRFKRNHRLPIEKLTAMSAVEIQSSADLQKIYSQSATLVHWLMFADNGRYRGALFELLRKTYDNSAKPETLSKLTGLSYEELDKKYEEFLKTIPE
jgi:hypothetical protein